MARIPDWLIYGGVVALAAAVSLLHAGPDAPPAPEAASEDELGAFLGPVTPFDPTVVVEAPPNPMQPASGTAFAVSAEGVWLTARHVVEGCRRPALIVGGGRAVAADVRLSRRTDVAVLFTEGGPAPLPVSERGRRLRVGQAAYHPGYPQARPGEVASRLIGRETLRVQGRGQRDEPVLAWAEIGRTEDLDGTLGGLSGGPALDGQGRVMAVTIAEAPRRGRVYTTAVESLTDATGELDLDDETPFGVVLSPGNYGTVSDDLRRDLRVAQVVCLPG